MEFSHQLKDTMNNKSHNKIKSTKTVVFKIDTFRGPRCDTLNFSQG